MIKHDSARINMSFAEWKLMRTEVQSTGLFYQCDPKGIWIQLPQVNTQGERQLHMRRVNVVRQRLQELRSTSKHYVAQVRHA